MKVRFRTNLGSRDAVALDLNYTECVYEAEVDVLPETAAELVRRGIAEHVQAVQAVAEEPEIKAVEQPEIKAVEPEPSPIAKFHRKSKGSKE